MSATMLRSPNRPTGGVTRHGVEPSLWLTVFDWAFLAVGFGVDLVAFRAALALVAADQSDFQVWLLAGAAGLMALFLMFSAGYLESERRETTMGAHGRLIVGFLVGIWALAGVAATFIRLTAEPAFTSDAFDTAAAGTGSTGESLAGGIDLGFATIYPANIPTALFMLVLYLGVGLGAYLFGRRSNRPLLTDLRRKRRAKKAPVEALAQLREQRDKAAVRAARLRRTSDEVSAHHVEIAALGALEAALVGYQDALDRRRSLAGQRVVGEQAMARLATDLDAIPEQVLTETRAAEAVGRAAEQHARTLLHRHLADPSRTVMDADVHAIDLLRNPEA